MSLKKFLFALTLLINSLVLSQVDATPQTEAQVKYEQKILAAVEKIQGDPALQVGKISPEKNPSLPIGIVREIGGTVYCVAIDEAVFKTNKATFNAYMAIDLPGATRKLAFAAENVNFSPSGILTNQGVTLKLISDYTVALGPNVDLVLKGGEGGNYIEFDCNGYKQTHLKGEFRFKGDLFKPTTPNAKYVTATLEVTVEDLHNMIATVNFSPFEVRGLDGYKFMVQEATIDWSDFQNPNAPLPTSIAAKYPDQIMLWRGFYLKKATVTLPDKFNQKNTPLPPSASSGSSAGGNFGSGLSVGNSISSGSVATNAASSGGGGNNVSTGTTSSAGQTINSSQVLSSAATNSAVTVQSSTSASQFQNQNVSATTAVSNAVAQPSATSTSTNVQPITTAAPVFSPSSAGMAPTPLGTDFGQNTMNTLPQTPATQPTVSSGGQTMNNTQLSVNQMTSAGPAVVNLNSTNTGSVAFKDPSTTMMADQKLSMAQPVLALTTPVEEIVGNKGSSVYGNGNSNSGGTTTSTGGATSATGNGSWSNSGSVGGSGTPQPNPGTATTIYVLDLFIDDSGISGTFGATPVLAKGMGDMEGWGFSIDNMSITLVSNKLIKGTLAGQINVPQLDDANFTYAAELGQNPTNPDKILYSFTIGISNDTKIKMPKLRSTLILAGGSTLKISNSNDHNRFIPLLNLTGKISIVNGTTANFTDISFEKLTVTTEKPYFLGGIFGLKSGTTNPKFSNFTASLTKIGFLTDKELGEVAITAEFGVRFGGSEQEDDPTSFSASADFSIVCKYDYPESDQRHLKYDRFVVNSIKFSANTTAFKLVGLLIFKENDPKFGKLFYGEIDLTIKSFSDEAIIVRAGFGKTGGSAGYKYWYTDCQIPVNLKIGQVTLTSFIGGVSNRVKHLQTESDMVSKASDVPKTISPQPPFEPNNNYGLNIKAGVGFKHTLNEEVINGNAMFSVQFNATGGILEVSFHGEAYSLVKISERKDKNVKNKITAVVDMSYNVPAKTFSAKITGDLVFANAIDGSVEINLLIAPTDWHLWINGPNNPANLSLKTPSGINLFTAETYLQCGKTIEGPRALPDYVADISGVSSARQELNGNSNVTSGNGLAMGMRINSQFEDDYHVYSGALAEYYATLNLQIKFGFDILMMKYPENAVCSQTGNNFGMNQKYCTGNLYFYTKAQAGGKRVGKKDTQYFNLFNTEFKGLLQGGFPKPSYVNGVVSARLEFLGFLKINYSFDFKFGDQCNINY